MTSFVSHRSISVVFRTFELVTKDVSEIRTAVMNHIWSMQDRVLGAKFGWTAFTGRAKLSPEGRSRAETLWGVLRATRCAQWSKFQGENDSAQKVRGAGLPSEKGRRQTDPFPEFRSVESLFGLSPLREQRARILLKTCGRIW